MTYANLVEAYFLKLRLNLKSEASRSYLNYAWWLLEPALHVTVFYFVFDVMLDRGGTDFVVFLLCAQIPFLWFSKSVSNAAGSIIGGRGLIAQMAIPKPFFPLLVVGQDIAKQLVVFACLLLFLAAMGFPPSSTWLLLPILMLTQVVLISGFALLAAAITPFIPDFRFLINTGMTMLMFASGIFYDYRIVLKEAHKQIFLLNPLAALIEAYRDILMRQAVPDWQSLTWVLGAGMLLLLFMLHFFRKNDAAYARLVIQ